MNIALPTINYEPQDPVKYRPAIGLIGCGAITGDHLKAYRKAGYNVVALCDLDRAAAEERRQEFFPDAKVYTDCHKLLARDDVEVVDIATHPEIRAELIEAALLADKHVLSQKPFVLDLDVGRRLVELAERRKRKLAVNQNARWAPHFSYMRQAIAAGLVGEVEAVHFAVQWDHNWVSGTAFDAVKHLILYDFAIHWFDMLLCFIERQPPRRVYASLVRSLHQKARPALLAQAMVEFDNAQASLVFDADTRFGKLDTTVVVGSRGTITSTGQDVNNQRVVLSVAGHDVAPELKGRWFSDGFHGTMGELLRSVEADREPSNSARDNLRSLALCFAAVASAERGEPVVPGTIGELPTS